MRWLEYDDIQGLSLRGYGEKKEAAFLRLRVTKPRLAGQWLRKVELTPSTHGYRPEVSAEDRHNAREAEPIATNLALTARGLVALGISEDEVRLTFGEAFAVGMAAERTRHILNDRPVSEWSWTDAHGEASVDAVWFVYASGKPTLAAHLEAFTASAEKNGLEILGAPLATSTLTDYEPFGFRDGISQPRIRHTPGEPGIAPGELVLGYPDGQNRDNAYRSDGAVTGLVTNGSYLVMRELAQDVPGFWRAMADYVGREPAKRDDRMRIASKMVGRWPSGSPMVGQEERDPHTEVSRLDAFGYRQPDPHGYGCPIGAHVRRMNPRDWLFGATESHALKVVARRRMLRRGRSFGDHCAKSALDMAADPAEIEVRDRGIYFIAIVADIERQFEFVQQTWANDPTFAGLTDNPDPLVGRAPTRRMVIQAKPVRARTPTLPEFVTMRGGGYFFLPGISAIRAIADRALRAPELAAL